MLRLIRQSEFIQGRWRNGMGVSWEIAASREEGASDFSWRLAMARIDADVPFSIYPGMDRVFMQLHGQGLDLEFEGGRVIQVHQSFVPHSFSCDVPLECKLLDGPCMDLNLFTQRGGFRSEVDVVQVAGEQQLSLRSATTVFFCLQGACHLSVDGASIELAEGDAAVARDIELVDVKGESAKLFVGHIIAL
jgi:environmental stress-induced protein Ves